MCVSVPAVVGVLSVRILGRRGGVPNLLPRLSVSFVIFELPQVVVLNHGVMIKELFWLVYGDLPSLHRGNPLQHSVFDESLGLGSYVRYKSRFRVGWHPSVRA